MLDLFGIMFSSIIMVLVILRAIHLDLTTPWFGPPPADDGNAAPEAPAGGLPEARKPVVEPVWRRTPRV